LKDLYNWPIVVWFGLAILVEVIIVELVSDWYRGWRKRR
jgi:hypothetical protein